VDGMGLPPDLQALLDFDEMVSRSVSNFGHAVRTKDLIYRAMMSRRWNAFPRRREAGKRVMRGMSGKRIRRRRNGETR
jgi:hypothetical protein